MQYLLPVQLVVHEFCHAKRHQTIIFDGVFQIFFHKWQSMHCAEVLLTIILYLKTLFYVLSLKTTIVNQKTCLNGIVELVIVVTNQGSAWV